MAIAKLSAVRSLLVLATLGAIAVLTPALASADPGTPAGPHNDPATPTVASVEKQLGTLAMRNAQLVDQYNQVRILVGKRQQAATSAKTVADQANAVYAQSNVQFTRIIQAQYESGSVGAAGALLDSSSDTNYLDRIDAMSLLSSHDADIVSRLLSDRRAAQSASAKAQSLLDTATTERDALVAKKATVEKQIRKYQDTLGTLTLRQQAAFQNRANPITSADQAEALTSGITEVGSAAGRKAVEYAIKQVGKPYVFGAAGPSAFDCSGLTMQAWQAAGVGLPHSAADQYNYGKHVSRNDLQPGDLLFFYSPIGHVTIYIGSGMMVSAPTEGEPVQVVSVASFDSDYVGATRLK